MRHIFIGVMTDEKGICNYLVYVGGMFDLGVSRMGKTLEPQNQLRDPFHTAPSLLEGLGGFILQIFNIDILFHSLDFSKKFLELAGAGDSDFQSAIGIDQFQEILKTFLEEGYVAADKLNRRVDLMGDAGRKLTN